MESIKVGIAQMTAVDDVEKNYLQILRILEMSIAHSGVRLVCFPENSLYMRLKEGGKVLPFDLSNEYILKIAEWAKLHQIFVHLGSLPLKQDAVIYNSSVLVDDQGKVHSAYRKMHLFDIHLEKADPIRESDVFQHGEAPKTFVIDGWKFGQTICYDLRFAELFSYYAQLEVDAILVPSAFLVKTGQAHWHVLLRARAIESQCYILASAQSGLHKSENGQRETYGHSLAVDPWGQLVVEIQESPQLEVIEMKRSAIQSVRRQIPMKGHRRTALLKSKST